MFKNIKRLVYITKRKDTGINNCQTIFLFTDLLKVNFCLDKNVWTKEEIYVLCQDEFQNILFYLYSSFI